MIELQESCSDFAGRLQPRLHALPECLGLYKVRRSGVDIGGNGIGAHADAQRRFSELVDGIMVTGAPPEVPQALIDQLAKGGRLVAPDGLGWHQELVLIEKDANGRIRRRSAGSVVFVPMRSGGA